MAAREIDLLGREAPGFEEARRRLKASPSRIAADCSRGTARSISNILRKHGIPSHTLPLRRPGRLSPKRRDLPLSFRLHFRQLGHFVRNLPLALRVTLIVVLVLGAGTLFLAWRAGSAISEDPVAVQGTGGGAVLSVQEIDSIALRSTVEIRGGGRVGMGFFVAPDLLLAGRAHSVGERVDIFMADGARRQGRVEKSDKWIGLSLIRLEGAKAAFLRLGDAVDLEKGQTLTSLGWQNAKTFIATQGVLRRIDLIDFGRLYYVIDAVAAADGTPVLDFSGRVVGVVTDAVPAGKGSSAVLPIDYVISGSRALLRRPQEGGAARRWNELISGVEEGDAAGYARIRSSLDRPGLYRAGVLSSEALDVIVWKYTKFSPPEEELFFDLVRGDEILCRPHGTTESWQVFTGKESEAWLDRLGQWLGRHDPKGRLYISRVRLNISECQHQLSGASLVLPSGNPGLNRVLLSR